MPPCTWQWQAASGLGRPNPNPKPNLTQCEVDTPNGKKLITMELNNNSICGQVPYGGQVEGLWRAYGGPMEGRWRAYAGQVAQCRGGPQLLRGVREVA